MSKNFKCEMCGAVLTDGEHECTVYLSQPLEGKHIPHSAGGGFICQQCDRKFVPTTEELNDPDGYATKINLQPSTVPDYVVAEHKDDKFTHYEGDDCSVPITDQTKPTEYTHGYHDGYNKGYTDALRDARLSQPTSSQKEES